MSDSIKNLYHSIFIFSFILLFPSLLLATEKKDFHTLRSYILSEVAARDIQQAFAYVDTLESLAKTRREEIKTDMVRAVLYYQIGNRIRALEIAMDAEQNYKKNRNYSDQIGAIGFIASNFQELGLFNEAIIYLDKAKKSIKHLSDEHLRGQYGALLYHEFIKIAGLNENYNKVKENIHQAYAYVELIEEGEQKNFFLATTIKFDAANEFYLGNYSKSKELYDKALTTLGTKEDLLYGEILLGKAKNALVDGRFVASLNYLKLVDAMVEASQYFQLKKNLYKTYMDYYEAVGDSVNYNTSHYHYLGTLQKNDQDLKEAANQVLLQLRSRMDKTNLISFSFATISTIAIILLTLVVGYMYRRNKRKTTRFNHVVEQLKKGGVSLGEIPLDTEIAIPDDRASNLPMDNSISDDTERRILTALSALEKDPKFFTNLKLTLPKMALELDTNTKYLAHVIKKHRGKNFNTYINDFRINYSLKLLQKDSKFLQYKISYIAEIVGFSTHSKFSSEFKRVVGISPSIYVRKMSKK